MLNKSETFQPMKLMYKNQAVEWTEALPIGNGRLGGMVFGGTQKEQIQLNEDTLWSGIPRDHDNKEAFSHLEDVRKLIFEGKYSKAQEHIESNMLGPWSEAYLPLGNLYLEFDRTGQISSYHRELNINNAMVTICYEQDGINFTREIFCSAPDNVMVVRLSADKDKSIDVCASLDSLLRYNTHNLSKDTLALKGRCPSHVEPNFVNCDTPVIYDENAKGMNFEIQLKAICDGGSIVSENGLLKIQSANSVVFILDGQTSFKGKDPAILCEHNLKETAGKPYEVIKIRHIEDYNTLFNRVNLYLGANGAEFLPTDERLKAYSEGSEDPQLPVLLFQFGRYLLISSSRAGTQPANLQGIWNKDLRPAWSSNYTTNINTEMNYWAAEVCNLKECHTPLFEMLKELAINGEKTAKIQFGCKGWTANHNVDLWRQASPVGGKATWAYWPMSAAWLCQHVWWHYTFNLSIAFLKEEAYPLMKGAAIFYLDWLIKDKSGNLVTCPSTSPENAFITPDGCICSVSMASTMDMSLIWDLFTNCIKASNELGIDEEFRNKLKSTRERLYKPGIGKHGQLLEWFEDFEESEINHRHVSHLFGLFPGNQITRELNTELMDACKISLERRGDEGTGWSLAWKVNLWARLGDGEHAYKLIKRQLKLVRDSSFDYTNQGGTYPNMFDAHPPFQIDGNFGVASGIAEMLLQSHTGKIHLLPAIPKAWSNGYVSGLKARGGFVISMEWNEGKVIKANITSTVGGRFRMYSDKNLRVIDGNNAPVSSTYKNNVLEFDTIPEACYSIL